MKHPDRREFLAKSAAGLGAATLAGSFPVLAAAAESPFKPEKGASLQLLRWTAFVSSDATIWDENTKKFTAATGVPVTIQNLAWNDVTPKAALAAQVGSGPDIVMGWNDDPFVYPDKLVDMTDVVDYMGKSLGGWYDYAGGNDAGKHPWEGETKLHYTGPKPPYEQLEEKTVTNMLQAGFRAPICSIAGRTRNTLCGCTRRIFSPSTRKF